MVRRFVLLAVLLGVGACPVLAASSLDRPADPVVLTGSAVPTLGGTPPGDVVAFRWTTGWEQVPVQVDERALVDLNKPFSSYTCAGGPYCFPQPPSGALALQYTDAATHTGADPDPTLDADDEIAFMAKDTGDQAPSSSEPPDVVPGSGVEVHVTDPLDGGEGWVYLFRQTGALDPSAGQSYVSYAFNLLSGSYLATYQLNGGPNPENSTITSAFYSRHFSDRWLDDALAITAGSATGVDVLDRHKLIVSGFGCFRTEDTLDAGEGCFVANKSGPVRAIRSYMGANSGPHTQRQHLFYERREDLQTFVRVHSLPGVEFFLDYSPAASAMVYRNDNNPAGVTIDGVPDVVSAGPFTWETVDGAQGGLTMLALVDTDIPGVGYTSSYLDDASMGGCTGDASSYGSSGVVTTGSLASTDVAAGATNHLVVTRVTYFEAPGEADGPGRQQQLANPLTVTVTGSGSTTTSTTLPGSGTPVAATKLIVVDKGISAKAVFVAKDPAITKGAGTDTALIGATLDFVYDNGADPASAGQFVALQGSPGWVVNKTSVAKYVNKAAPTGGGTKVVVVKPGKLVKLVGKSLGDSPIDISSPSNTPGGSAYTACCIDDGPERHCFCSMFFGCVWKSIAGGTGAKLVCKNGLPDSACLATAP